MSAFFEGYRGKPLSTADFLSVRQPQPPLDLAGAAGAADRDRSLCLAATRLHFRVAMTADREQCVFKTVSWPWHSSSRGLGSRTKGTPPHFVQMVSGVFSPTGVNGQSQWKLRYATALVARFGSELEQTVLMVTVIRSRAFVRARPFSLFCFVHFFSLPFL